MIIDKIRDKTITALFLLIAIFPFALGSRAAIKLYVNYHQFKIEYILITIFYFWVLSLLFRPKFSSHLNETEIVVIIFLSAIIIRWMALVFFNSQPTSDFLTTVNSALNHMNGPYKDLYSARYPYWGFYILTLGVIYKIFGTSLMVVKSFNLLFAGFTAVGLYFLGKKVLGTRRFGAITALIYILWPADILYKNLPTGEHIFIMLFPYACIAFLYAVELIDKNIKASILVFLLTGVILGIMDMYKPVAIILWIAFMMTFIIFLIFSSRYRGRFYSDKNFWTNFVFIAVLFLAYWLTKQAFYSLIHYETMYTPNTIAYGATLRVGLDPEIGGRFDKDTALYIKSLWTDSNENYQYANSVLLQETKSIVLAHKSELINLFKNKFFYTWNSDNAFYVWTTAKQADDGITAFDPSKLGIFIKPFLDAYLIFSLFLSMLGAIYCAIFKRNILALGIGLYIFGFSTLLLLTEYQQRYRSVLISAIPLFVAFGIYALNEFTTYLRRMISHLSYQDSKPNP